MRKPSAPLLLDRTQTNSESGTDCSTSTASRSRTHAWLGTITAGPQLVVATARSIVVEPPSVRRTTIDTAGGDSKYELFRNPRPRCSSGPRRTAHHHHRHCHPRPARLATVVRPPRRPAPEPAVRRTLPRTGAPHASNIRHRCPFAGSPADHPPTTPQSHTYIAISDVFGYIVIF